MVLRNCAKRKAGPRSQAKSTAGKEADRDAFCIRVLKRGGGEVSLVSPWWPGRGRRATRRPGKERAQADEAPAR